MIHRYRGVSNGGGNAQRNRRRQLTTKSSVGRVRRHSSSAFFFWRKPFRIQIGFCLLLVITLYLHPEWFIAFLRGPKGAPVPQQEPHQQIHTEDPGPMPDKIFTAFTERQKKKIEDMRKGFLQQKNEGKLIPCRIDGDCQSPDLSKKEMLSWLRGSSAPSKIKLYNSLPFHRYICEKVIWGNGGTLELDVADFQKCLSNGMPFVQTAAPPPISGKGMKPIELFWNYDSLFYYNDGRADSISFATEEFQCPIPCRAAGDYALLSIIAVKDTRWEILSTMEGEKYYGQAHVNAKAYQHDQFYAVTSFQSDVPLPYFSWAEYNIQHPAVDFNKVIKGASFLAKNCDSDSKREELVLKLMETSLRVDSLSGCHHNAEAPKGISMDNKTAILEHYLFHLAFENQRADDYITEKLWGALAAGTLPVYLGAPNIKDHVPRNSVIFVEDFASSQELADYLVRLTKDKALYDSYHTWRTTPIDPSFRDKYEFTKTHSTCRMCKWAYAKRHGLAWNHTRQQIEEPRIDHKTCRNKVGLVGYPFKEYWLTESGDKTLSVESPTSSNTCILDAVSRVVKLDGGAIHRKVYDQDGITDLVIDTDNNGQTYQLKFETPIATDNLKNIPENYGKQWWLQDGRSRMTILTSLPVKMSIVKQGTVQLFVSTSLRIRVIVEDVDIFHKGAKNNANYFGDLMTQDFFNPLESYVVIPN